MGVNLIYGAFYQGKDMLSLYFNNNEDSKLFQGKALRLGGSRALYEDNNTYFGDLSWYFMTEIVMKKL